MYPIFIENSKIPKLLSKLAPINIKAISLLFWVFIDGEADERLKSHERIHYAQWKECLFLFFPILYVWYYIKNLIRGNDKRDAYFFNPFEVEAYANENDFFYILNRKRFAWREYINEGKIK